MTRTRPGRSVSQIAPSLAKARDQGASSPWATLCWMSLSGPGCLRGARVGAAVGEGAGAAGSEDADGVDLDRAVAPPVPQALRSAATRRTAPARIEPDPTMGPDRATRTSTKPKQTNSYDSLPLDMKEGREGVSIEQRHVIDRIYSGRMSCHF